MGEMSGQRSFRVETESGWFFHWCRICAERWADSLRSETPDAPSQDENPPSHLWWSLELPCDVYRNRQTACVRTREAHDKHVKLTSWWWKHIKHNHESQQQKQQPDVKMNFKPATDVLTFHIKVSDRSSYEGVFRSGRQHTMILTFYIYKRPNI